MTNPGFWVKGIPYKILLIYGVLRVLTKILYIGVLKNFFGLGVSEDTLMTMAPTDWGR